MLLTNKNLKSFNVDELIRFKIEKSELESILIIVPTNRKLRRLKKEIITGSPGKTADVINLETLGTLTEKILNEWKYFKKLSEAAATVLIKQSAKEVDLQYLNVYKSEIPHGTLDRIKNVISEYKKHGVSPELLRKEAEKLDDLEKRKAIDIANIYQNYKAKCYKLSALEAGDIYSEIVSAGKDKFHSAFKRLFPEVREIVVVGFDEFFRLEIEILDFLKLDDSVDLFLTFDYFDRNRSLFAHLEETYSKLKSKNFKQIEDLTPEASDMFLQNVRKFLFSNKNKFVLDSYKEKIAVVEAADKINEVKFVAKEIKRKLTEENVEPHKICVAFNLIQNYTPIVRDIFNMYGIPVNITDRFSLDKSLPVTALITVLEILENDYFYKDIFRAFSNVYVRNINIDLDVLIKVATNLKIVGGKTNWEKKLSNALSFTGSFDEENEDEEKETSDIEKALQSIYNINSLLENFNKPLSIPEFQDELKLLAYKLGIFEKILEDKKEDAEINIKAVTTFFETTDEIFELLAKEYGENKKFNIKFYLEQLRTASGWARFNVKERSDFGVLVTTVNEIRGIKFDYLFICGMNDGEFPTRYNPEIFYSGSYAKDSARHLLEEKFHFYQALGLWRMGLYLTYAKHEEEKELVESTFVKDFKKLFAVKEINESNLDNLVYSKEELDKLIGNFWIEERLDEFLKSENLTLNEDKIRHSLSVDKLRTENPFAESVYNGYILSHVDNEIALSDKAVSKLENFVRQEFSVSQLETYANCPHRFFLDRVLKIEELREPTEEIEAVELGNLMHEIFYEYYSFLREKNINPVEEEIVKLKNILFGIARKKYDEYKFDSPLSFYEKEKIFGINGNEEDSVLYRFLTVENQNFEDYTPSFFEVGFGSVIRKNTDKILSATQAISIGNIKLRGKIDRIDINKNDFVFRIIDYKLSDRGKPSKKDLEEGYSLQLPVYLYATRKILTKYFENNFSPAGAIIFSLKFQADKFGHLRVIRKSKTGLEGTIAAHEKLIEIAVKKIEEYVENISKGKFHLTFREDPEKNACKYCNFKTICRIQESVN